MNYAIRSGITITTTYAIKQCGRLLKETPRTQQRDELMQLQLRLESKIRIISPAIDMIDLISARGNTILESAVSLTKEIRYEIQKLGVRLSDAANEEELLRRKSSKAKAREQVEQELRSIILAIKALLTRIEDAVPLINLAITTSGVNLSTKLSGTISPSRLLQASTFLTAADSKYTAQPGRRCQVGPTWTLSLYMLFTGHAARPVDEQGVRETTWKEVIHKARIKLIRTPLEQLYDLPGEQSSVGRAATDSIPVDAKTAEFAYQLLVIEDLDDDRVHTFEYDDEQPGSFDDVATAGIRDVIPIHEVSKVFYADTGKILNIGGDNDTHNPVLLLRRDVHAEAPRRMLHRSQMGQRDYYDESELEEVQRNGVHDEQSEIDEQLHRESTLTTPLKQAEPQDKGDVKWRLPADLDPEWMAFEVYTEEPDSENDLEDNASANNSRPTSSREDSLGPGLTGALSNLTLRSPASTSNTPNSHNSNQLVPSQLQRISPTKPPLPMIKTSLSLLEMLLKLTALQQFRQDSHLSIEDEVLNFFLEDSATAGAGSDKDYRQRLRHDAVRRVGFDPYDESPVKRRGEEYIAHARQGASPRPRFDPRAFDDVLGYGNGTESLRDVSTPDFIRPSVEHPSYSLPSSPSPLPQIHQQTPSPRNSAPPQAGNGNVRTSSQSSVLATPPSTAKSRQAFLRTQSEPKGTSPSAREFVGERTGEK